MLLALRAANHRSISQSIELDMRRTHDSDPGILGPGSAAWDIAVNSVAAVYGPNASGKTAVLTALAFVTSAVRNSFSRWTSGEPIPREPFLLDDSSRQEWSEFEVEFVTEGRRYQYGFALDSEQVHEEWLYFYRTNKRTVLFERTGRGSDGYVFNRQFNGPNRTVADVTRDDVLFLSACGAVDHPGARPAYRWLTDQVRWHQSSGYEAAHDSLAKRMHEDELFRERLEEMLVAADAGIGSASVLAMKIDRRNKNRMIGELTGQGLTTDAAERIYLRLSQEGRLQLQLGHQVNGKLIVLPFDAESMGTRAFLSHAGAVIDALDDGAVCVFDEIDTSLHPDLVAELVRLFQSPDTNPRQAQLIFSTHDASLLEPGGAQPDVLDRDQIWVAEKRADGSTTLTPVTDYKPRTEENLRRGYLNGRYGGLPSARVVETYRRAATV